MKKIFLFVASLMTTLFGAYAATGITLDADLKTALPSGEFFLPIPASNKVNPLIWQDDSTKYFQYKELGRNIRPGDKFEFTDSVWASMNEQYYFALYRVSADSVMDAPFIDVSWLKTKPYTVSYTRNTTDFPKMNALELLCEQMKEDNTSNLWRTRPRPYFYFEDVYKNKQYRQTNANDIKSSSASSYPSGHGYFAGLFGMCLLYIDPDNALAIKKMIDEWCDCRLLLGAHWKTDLDAGKQLGAIAFAIAMNYPQFRNLVEDAKAELEAYRTAHTAPVTQTYTRAHAHMNLNTLCYPYQIDAYTGASFYTMLYKEVDGSGNPVNIYLQAHEGPLQAGKPYFYVPEGSELVCEYSGEYTAAGNDGNGVYGVYDDLTPVELGMYVTYNNLFTKAGSNVKLHEYRAYVKMSEVSTNPEGPAYIPGRQILKITNTSAETTDIEVLQNQHPQSTKVLSNGQLIILSDGNPYNAVGQELR